MAKLIMLIGLPGVGKSTYAKSLLNTNKLNYCSSDETRKQLYGDASIQGDNNKVFRVLHNNIKQFLLNGEDVVYDATNVTRKNRKNVISQFKHIASIEAHVVWAPVETCLQRDADREKHVGERVIKKFLYRWQSPYYDEGFDYITVINNSDESFNHIEYEATVVNNMKIPHDNPHHILNIYEHCISAANYLKSSSCDTNLIEAAKYHDIGKPLTKSYKLDEQGIQIPIAHYYQHDNVGGYLAYGLYDLSHRCEVDKSIIVSWLVSTHMQPFFQSSYYKSLTGDLKTWIDLLHTADINNP